MIDILPDIRDNPEKVKKLSGPQLEQLVTEVVGKHGFASGHEVDGDLVAFGRGQRFKFRIKTYRSKKVGVGEAREFIQSIQDDPRYGGLYICTQPNKIQGISINCK